VTLTYEAQSTYTAEQLAAWYAQPAYQPQGNGQFTTHQRLSILIHAMAKKGKSTLSATVPWPALVFDAEGSWRFIPVRKVYWDPTSGQPLPTYDGTWDACVVHVRDWQTFNMTWNYLRQWATPFVSIVVDSITELQRRCKENLKGTEVMKIQDWGVLLAQMDRAIRGIRDLCLIPSIAVRCVVFVAETRFDRDTSRWVPAMQGQIERALPYWVDVCGYMYPDFDLDANNQPTRELRRIWISQHPQYEAGERVQGRLGQYINFYRPPEGQVGRDIQNWMTQVFGLQGGTQQ
jgi:hypothetical protein